jgi:hypothetical protein
MNIMKKLLLKFAAVLAIFGAAIMFSCEEPPPPVPLCEAEGWGEVTVQNLTGYQLKVDVTYTSTGVNYEKWLSNGSSHTYQMDKGRVYIWASFDGDEWVYDTYSLSACEDLTYKWYLDKKKSTQNSMYLVITNRNGDVLKTVDEFQYVKRN